MDGFWLVLAFLSGMGVGSAAAIRECANACLNGGRKWWKVAIFCAEHRVSLRRFKLELDYKAKPKSNGEDVGRAVVPDSEDHKVSQ